MISARDAVIPGARLMMIGMTTTITLCDKLIQRRAEARGNILSNVNLGAPDNVHKLV